MRLSTYIQRTRALGDLPVTPHDIDTIGQLIEEGQGFDAVLKKRTATLTPLVLLGIWRAHRRLQEHLGYLQDVIDRRQREGQHPIAINLLKSTVTRHEVAVLERAEALAPPGGTSEHRRRDAIKAALSLWKACLAITRKQARLTVAIDTDIPELVDAYGDYAERSTNLGDLAAHRWLAIRRGERLGALRLDFELPRDAMQEQIEARASQLAAVSAGRDAEVLLDALVLTDLVEWSLSLKDEEAELLATRTACNAYLGLLTTPRSNHPLVAGISVPARGPIGVAVVLRDGKLVGSGVADIDGDPVKAVERLLGNHPVEALVFPASSQRRELLQALVHGFGSLDVLRADPRAMRVGVDACPEDAPRAVKEALVLARRIVRPMQTWMALDPIDLGLAEYQHELDTDALRAALCDMQALAQADVRPDDLDKARPSAAPARPIVRPVQKPLNPMIKSVDDLRPGMEINGVITNITQFGAFVNIGLPHEGLVHVSELADHFVNDPNEVVTVGQQVKARVLGVDRGRRRISLSMRPDRPLGAPTAAAPRPAAYADRTDGPRREEGGSGGGVPLDDIPGRGRARRQSGGFGPRPQSNMSRAQAMAELERLFKK
ncbi:MAG: S1 RNA-binding domain-containing protein [Myxococcales bacterium]|nr:S1 RNA-binding domain-containing protein [Myxococcales bacterium]MCB9550763.1 S1 RNA-binding domain-containing protein [Myxococcales bacterium]